MPIENNDPLLALEAHITRVESGGYIVRQLPGPYVANVKAIETFCANMDAVADLLGLIYAPPANP